MCGFFICIGLKMVTKVPETTTNNTVLSFLISERKHDEEAKKPTNKTNKTNDKFVELDLPGAIGSPVFSSFVPPKIPPMINAQLLMFKEPVPRDYKENTDVSYQEPNNSPVNRPKRLRPGTPRPLGNNFFNTQPHNASPDKVETSNNCCNIM